MDEVTLAKYLSEKAKLERERPWREKALSEGGKLLEQLRGFVGDCKREAALKVLSQLEQAYPDFASQPGFIAEKKAIAELQSGNNAEAVVAVLSLTESFEHFAMGFGE